MKWPRFAFEKYEGAEPVLTTQMKSVGEAMAIGRTFKEAFLKAFRSLELGRSGRLFGQTAPGGAFDARHVDPIGRRESGRLHLRTEVGHRQIEPGASGLERADRLAERLAERS